MPTARRDSAGPLHAANGRNEPQSGDRLERYRAKRSFEATPEPEGPQPEGPQPEGPQPASSTAAGEDRFVVQRHDARRLHYDFRIQVDGVLVSWAVPKGPSYDPHAKRLAVHVEDHPLDYEGFEGVIPEALYGAGTVIVWDHGTYRNLTHRGQRPVSIVNGIAAGHVSLWLEGEKLRGGWSLTRLGRAGKNGAGNENWLLVKKADDRADPGRDITTEQPGSVLSGRTNEEVGASGGPRKWSRGRATWVPPMLAQLVKPEQHRGPGMWQYERKLDGLRCIAVRNGAEVELWSRNHLSYTHRFPGIAAALGRLPAESFTLDGEIVAFEGTATSFSRLQRPDPTTKPVLIAFDLLQLLGRDTTPLPLTDRQRLLSQLLDSAGAQVAAGPEAQATGGTQAQVVALEPLVGDPVELLKRACSDGWEGIVAKRVDAAYRPGRSPAWQKLKCNASQELVIAGWTDPGGSRRGFGALLVGYYDGGALRYAGKVGTGFDEATLSSLHVELASRELSDPPFADPVNEKGAHWAAPELVGAVSFTEWTADGRLRHPSFQGLRPDKKASEVRRERPA
ncbi:MAG: non-homologous end-joining DNA ligase [Acidimicrobiales bacterium]